MPKLKFSALGLSRFSQEKRNVMVYMLSDILAKGIPFLLLPIYTVFLSPEQFGNIAIFNIIVEVAIIMVVFGGNSYYRVEYFKRDNNHQLFSQLFANLKITFPIALILQVLFIWSDINPSNQAWYWLIGAVFIALMQSIVLLFIAEFQCQHKALNVGLTNLLSAFTVAIVTLILLNFDFAEQSRYIGFLVGSSVVALVTWRMAVQMDVKPTPLTANISTASLKFGLGVLPHALSWWARTGMDRLLIAKFVSVYQVGLYSIAAQISLVVIVIANAANQAFTPKFMKMLTEHQYKQSMLLCVKILAIYLLISVLVALFSPLIFDWFIDDKYQQAAQLLPLMCVIAFCQATVTLLSNFLYFFKKVKTLSIITSVTSILHVAIAYWVVEPYGVQGVIASSILTYLISALVIFTLALLLLKREHHAQSQLI